MSEIDEQLSEFGLKMEAFAQQLGIDWLKARVPFKKGQVQWALAQGDEHLNTLPLGRWDDMHPFVKQRAATIGAIRPPVNWPLSYTVCVLKHVARYHYLDEEE